MILVILLMIVNIQKKYNSATFDSRVFNLPKKEVCNYFIWRQQDTTRNAIQMVGQSNFNHNKIKIVIKFKKCYFKR